MLGTIIAVAVVAAVILTNRTVVDGGVRIRWGYFVPLLAGVLAVAVDRRPLRRLLARPWGWVPFAVIGADAAVAVVFHAVGASWHLGLNAGLPALPGLGAIGALVAGATVIMWDGRIVDWTAAATAVVSTVAGIEQMLRRHGQIIPHIGALFARFDRAVGIRYTTQFDLTRAEGWDVNPNSYAFLGVVTLIWAIFGMRKGPLRTVTATASLLMIGLGQSRTALTAVLVVGVVALIDLWRRRTPIRQIALLAGKIVAIGALVAVVLVVVLGPTIVQGYLGRVSSGSAVASQGSAADPSFNGRVEVWKRAVVLIRERPLGYYGAPAGNLGGSADSEYIWRLIRAGWPYLLIFVGLIVWLVFAVRPRAAPLFGIAVAATLVASGVAMVATQILGFAVLGWFCIGAAQLLDHSPDRCPGPGNREALPLA